MKNKCSSVLSKIDIYLALSVIGKHDDRIKLLSKYTLKNELLFVNLYHVFLMVCHGVT